MAVALAATASAVGALVLRGCSPVHRLDKATVAEGRGRRQRAGWNSPQVRILMVIALGAFAIGAVQVSTAAHAEALRTSAGLLVAATAAGGVVASFLYGSLTLPGTLGAPGRAGH